MKYPKMTRCHFQFIADIIAAQTAEGAVSIFKYPAAKQELAEAFADELYGTNNNFDRGRFMAACQEEK